MSRRHDFYGPIHKGLRLGSAQMLTRLGQLDWRDDRAARELVTGLRTHLILAREHLAHEDAEFIGALRTRAPELAARLEHEHADHNLAFAELATLMAAAETTSTEAREQAGRALYLRFSTYFGEDLAHMAREEQEAMPIFQAHFSDEELMAMEMRIIQAISQEQLTQYYFLMVPGMNPAERAAFLLYVKTNAPPEAFQHLLDHVARTALPARDFRALNNELAMAA